LFSTAEQDTIGVMDNTNDKNNNQESSQDVTGDDLHSLAQNYAQQKKVSTSAQEDQDISDLQREIQAQFSDSIATQESEIAPNVNTPNESAVVSPDETPSPDEDFPFPSVVSKKETASEDQQAQQTSLADIENPGGTSNVIHEEEIIQNKKQLKICKKILQMTFQVKQSQRHLLKKSS
jgi:hypothetical protein